VFNWTNVLGAGDEYGAVFVWTCRGRVEVVGTVFSFPEAGQRKLCHEFHSLSLSTLDVNRSGSNPWIPEAPGIGLAPIPGAPAPASSAPRRLIQMRALAHDFSASTKDSKERRWELRRSKTKLDEAFGPHEISFVDSISRPRLSRRQSAHRGALASPCRLPAAFRPLSDKLPKNFVDNRWLSAIFVVIRLDS
jgi:hypothetical protein